MEQVMGWVSVVIAQVQPTLEVLQWMDPAWITAVLALLIWIRLGAVKRETRRTARLLASSGFLGGHDSD